MNNFNLFNNMYYGKKVLITGHTGFKGSWLTFWLVNLGAKVIGYSLPPPTNPNLFDILDLKKNIINITNDIRDYKSINDVINLHQPEFVFHLASQAIVKKSYIDPKYTFETNINGTINLLESLRKIKSIKVILIITSDKCYENKENNHKYIESDKLGGIDSYSSSKACVELIVRSYRESFYKNISLATARSGNIIGGGDWGENRLVPDCIRFLINNEEIKIRNPDSIRPWFYILDSISAYLYLGSKMYESTNYNSAWNFGPAGNKNYKVIDLVKDIISIWKSGNNYQIIRQDFKENNNLRLNIKKSKSKLKWYTIYNTKIAIKKAIDWYYNFYNKKDMINYTLQEIDNFIIDAKKNNLEWIK